MNTFLIKRTLGIVILVLFALVACENPTASDDDTADDNTNDGVPEGEQVTAIDPPDSLIATLALNNGTSAVMEVTFAETDGTAQLTASATYTVSGNIRYQGTSFDEISGSYDAETGDVSITATASGGSSFVITGTWDPDTGFSGTVSLRNPEGVEFAAGSINGVGVAEGQESTVSIFVGTYGGSVYGSWNGVVDSDRFYGTYAASDGSDDRGSFSASYNSTNDEVASGAAGPDDIPFGGSVLSDGESISGWYAGDVTDDVGNPGAISGTWSGVKVDDNNDAPEFGVTSHEELIANRVFQAIGSAIRIAQDTLNDDPGGATAAVSYPENGAFDPTITIDENATVFLDSQFDGEPSEATFEGYNSLEINIGAGGYTDPVSGLTLGEGKISAGFDLIVALSIRDLATISMNNSESDVSFIVITFPDGTTGNLSVEEGTIDSDNETVGGSWYFPDAGVGDPPKEVSDVVEAALF